MQPTRTENPLKLWLVLGAVAILLGGVLFIVKRSEAPAEERDYISDETYGRAASSSEPSKDDDEDPEETDDYSTQSSPSFEREVTDSTPKDSDSTRRTTVADLIRERDAETLDRIAKAEAAQANAAPAAEAADQSRFFTLELSGTIGGAPLDPHDQQTWARLSYFLHDEAPARCYLVYPDGSIPLSKPKGPGTGASPRKNQADDSPPVGDTSNPEYRLVVDASSSSGGSVTFYGKAIGSKFRCRITCRVEKRRGADFVLVEQTTVDESSTPAKGRGPDVDASTYVRQMYDVALDKLTKKLAGLAVFRAK